MKFLRSLAKHVLENGAMATRLNDIARRGRRGRLLILAYHNVIADSHGAGADESLHLPLDRFVSQMDELCASHRIVRLDAALYDAPTDRPGAPPAIAITFDDAYAGTFAHALPVLRDRGLPATVFVPPGRLGGQAFWWDEYRPVAGREAQGFRSLALTRGGGRTENIDAIARELGVSRVDAPESARSALPADIDAALSGHPGLTVGAHSWSHPSLLACSPADLARELEDSRGWLADRYGPRMLPMISYPYGLADARVERAAQEAGFQWGLRIEGGWVGRPAAPLRIPRLNIPASLTSAGFRLRIDGVLGG